MQLAASRNLCIYAPMVKPPARLHQSKPLNFGHRSGLEHLAYSLVRERTPPGCAYSEHVHCLLNTVRCNSKRAGSAVGVSIVYRTSSGSGAPSRTSRAMRWHRAGGLRAAIVGPALPVYRMGLRLFLGPGASVCRSGEDRTTSGSARQMSVRRFVVVITYYPSGTTLRHHVGRVRKQRGGSAVWPLCPAGLPRAICVLSRFSNVALFSVRTLRHLTAFLWRIVS